MLRVFLLIFLPFMSFFFFFFQSLDMKINHAFDGKLHPGKQKKHINFSLRHVIDCHMLASSYD